MSFDIEIDMDACTGCGTCYEVCPSECFDEPEGGKVSIIEDNRDDCVGCRAWFLSLFIDSNNTP